MNEKNYLKIGLTSPVSSGETALFKRQVWRLMNEYVICLISDKIYSKEDHVTGDKITRTNVLGSI